MAWPHAPYVYWIQVLYSSLICRSWLQISISHMQRLDTRPKLVIFIWDKIFIHRTKKATRTKRNCAVRVCFVIPKARPLWLRTQNIFRFENRKRTALMTNPASPQKLKQDSSSSINPALVLLRTQMDFNTQNNNVNGRGIVRRLAIFS